MPADRPRVECVNAAKSGRQAIRAVIFSRGNVFAVEYNLLAASPCDANKNCLR
jgi:hypothetical protein